MSAGTPGRTDPARVTEQPRPPIGPDDEPERERAAPRSVAGPPDRDPGRNCRRNRARKRRVGRRRSRTTRRDFAGRADEDGGDPPADRRRESSASGWAVEIMFGLFVCREVAGERQERGESARGKSEEARSDRGRRDGKTSSRGPSPSLSASMVPPCISINCRPDAQAEPEAAARRARRAGIRLNGSARRCAAETGKRGRRCRMARVADRKSRWLSSDCRQLDADRAAAPR